MRSEQKFSAGSSREALAGLHVLEISSTPGASFSAALFADFNASVYVGESLPDGSAMRHRKPGMWWQIIARNKKSIAVDTSHPDAGEIVRKLLSQADVVITDVPARDRSNHPWLREAVRVPHTPLFVEVFPTGADQPATWPWSRSSDLSAASTGLMALTGIAGKTPVQPEFPMTDYLAGTLAATRAIAELRRAKLVREIAEDVAVPLHQAIFRMIEWQMPMATVFGSPQLRNGNAFPMNYSISNMHLTRDGNYVTFSAANDAQAHKLMEMVGGKELCEDPRFASSEARRRGLEDLYKITEKWMAERTLNEVLGAASRHDVVAGPVHSTKNIVIDSHVESRGNIVEVATESGPSIPMPGVVPRVEGWAAAVRSAGPSLGAHTAEALTACGFSEDFISRAAAEGLVATGFK